jgi:hypothetical protein
MSFPNGIQPQRTQRFAEESAIREPVILSEAKDSAYLCVFCGQ